MTFFKFEDLTSTASGYYDPRLDQNPFGKFSPEWVERLENNKKCKAAADFTHVFLYCKHTPSEDSILVIMPIWEDRIDAAEWIFLPPLALLLLGLGIGWVVKGFRRPA